MVSSRLHTFTIVGLVSNATLPHHNFNSSLPDNKATLDGAI
jgi:hypothetical protein